LQIQPSFQLPGACLLALQSEMTSSFHVIHFARQARRPVGMLPISAQKESSNSTQTLSSHAAFVNAKPLPFPSTPKP